MNQKPDPKKSATPNPSAKTPAGKPMTASPKPSTTPKSTPKPK